MLLRQVVATCCLTKRQTVARRRPQELENDTPPMLKGDFARRFSRYIPEFGSFFPSAMQAACHWEHDVQGVCGRVWTLTYLLPNARSPSPATSGLQTLSGEQCAQTPSSLDSFPVPAHCLISIGLLARSVPQNPFHFSELKESSPWQPYKNSPLNTAR